MNKIQRRYEAAAHIKTMQQKYETKTKETVKASCLCKIEDYPIVKDKIDAVAGQNDTKITVRKTDTVSAVYGVNEQEITLLNFASYKHPGGGYTDGTMAQEEALCSESNLYNILSCFDSSIYAEQRKDTCYSLYRSHLIYTPDVVFVRSGYIKHCNVITCAAPNASAALKHKEVTKESISCAMKERIDYILYIAATHTSRDTLILGAFGCGVFGNNVQEVAEIFFSLLSGKYKGVFKNVIFAVPDKEKYDVFSSFAK